MCLFSIFCGFSSKVSYIDHFPLTFHMVSSHTHKQVTQVEKFNVKNHALKVLEKKLEQQLHQKKETVKAEYEVGIWQWIFFCDRLSTRNSRIY